jgi:hypothetical protein
MKFFAPSLIGIFCVMASSTALAKAPNQRKDLSKKIAKIVCADKKIDLKNSFANKIYDAQIDGQLLFRINGGKSSIKDAARKARAMAKTRKYHGYAFGVCDSGVGFSAATPAPMPLRGKTLLPRVSLNKHCKSWRADFASAKPIAPRRLKIIKGKISLPNKNGVLSVTCQPKKPRWLGPVQWYMAPVGKGPGKTPAKKILTKSGGTREQQLASLYKWINETREIVGLSKLIINENLEFSADTLAIGKRLSHDRKMLRSTEKNLKPTGIHLIGENRVKSSNLEQLATLLWNSPRHRGLLLNKKATYIGANISSNQVESFAVITVGSSRLTMAKRP